MMSMRGIRSTADCVDYAEEMPASSTRASSTFPSRIALARSKQASHHSVSRFRKASAITSRGGCGQARANGTYSHRASSTFTPA
jgi:hypothetical protein